MLRKNVVKGVLALSAAAALFAVLTVQAQTTTTETRPSTTGQTGTTGSTGSTGNSSTTATGQSGTSGSSQSGTSDTSTSGQTGTSGTEQAGATASGSGATSLSRSDKKMLMDMAQANMAEIEAGRLAQSKSQSEQVKNFAQQMIDDHTKALDDIKQLAQTKGVTLPTELDRAHKALTNKLSSLSGDAFDRRYMAKAGVSDHKKVHGMLNQAQARAKDPDLKALASRTLPVVDQHLNSAQQLNKNTARGSSKTEGTTGSSDKK